MKILLERPDLLIIDKPADLPTIPDRFGSPSVHGELQALRGEKLWVVHRLDREVTGILLFARHAAAHRALSMAFEHHLVQKTYEAWTSGAPPSEPTGEFSWEDVLMRGKKRAYVHPAGKQAVTIARWEGPAPMADPLRPGLGDLGRWTLQPKTGRNHQLRVQLALRGWPIAGDALYGSEVVWPLPGIALRAVRLEIPKGVLGAALLVDAPGLAKELA
jgi:tRNA pseudouridine32 synthase/23S rRNA pseudouridine746 synthase